MAEDVQPHQAAIFTGRDAFRAVAQPKGQWNWALVGPDPEALPLIGGGMRSVDEMRDCVAQNQDAVLFGLLRLTFGTGRLARTKYVFVHASCVDDAAANAAPPEGASASGTRRSLVAMGQAMGRRPAMEKTLGGFVHYTAKVEVTSPDDITVERIIERVQKVSAVDGDAVTTEAFLAALEETLPTADSQGEADSMGFMAPPPAEEAKADAANDSFEQQSDTEEQALTPAKVKLAETQPDAQPEATPGTQIEVQAQASFEAHNQAQPQPQLEEEAEARLETQLEAPPEIIYNSQDNAKPKESPEAQPSVGSKASVVAVTAHVYRVGDRVFVCSKSTHWHDDGYITEVLDVGQNRDGLALPSETVKVQYNNGRCFKWVTPARVEELLRPSDRPAFPPPLVGDLLKETHNWITEWHMRHFQLSRGFLQWWMSIEDARKGTTPNGSFSLLDMQLLRRGTAFQVRTANSRGTTYNFDARTPDNAEMWLAALRHHADYCESLREWIAKRKR